MTALQQPEGVSGLWRGSPGQAEPKALISCTVGTVAAPCGERLSAGELAEALLTGDVGLRQVASFFLELDLDAQRNFAADLGVPKGA